MKRRFFPLPLAFFLLASCGGNPDSLAGGSSSTETGEISLAGRVVGSNNALISGVVVTLAKAGISDTTDSLGRYRIQRDPLAKEAAGMSIQEIVDTLIFTRNSQQVAALGVTKLVDSLSDVEIVQRDISGALLQSAVSIGKIEAVLSGDGIPNAKPVMAEFFYNRLSSDYSGFVYFPAPGSTQNFSVYINAYDTSGRFTGRSQTVPFNSLAGDITMPAFNPGNAIPVANAGRDTIFQVNALLALHGTAVDSFGGAIAKWEWDIGGTGVFKTTATGDTVIRTPAQPAGNYPCILRVTDNDGNTSPNDTMLVRIPPNAPAVSVLLPANSRLPTWSWNPGGGGNGMYRYRLDNADLSTGATATTSRSYTPASNLANGSHTLCVQERDAEGNESASGCATVTVNYTPLSAPVVSLSPPVLSTTNKTPTWTWSSGGGGVGTYRYKADDPDLSTGTTQTTAPSYTPSTALGYGSHTLYVQESDATGNWSSSGSASVVIPNANPQKLAAVGDSGTILYSTDGGTTWMSEFSGVTSNLNAVFFTNSNDGWAVGAGPKGGVNGLSTAGNAPDWVGSFVIDANFLNGIDFVDTKTGWVVGNSGGGNFGVSATTDRGATWVSQNALGLDSLNAVFFLNASVGWVVGQSGRILKTVNGGTTWTMQASGTASELKSIHFVDANTAWIAGAGGAILKTVNGGATWTAQTSGTTSPLYSVYLPDASTGWVVGANGIILKTVNGGASWTAQSSGTANLLYSVYFMDDNTGWVVGANGTILKTTDGGATWTAQSSGTTHALRCLNPIP